MAGIIEYYSDLNINGNQIKDFVVDKVSALPTAKDGKFVYLTAQVGDNIAGLYYCKGSTWSLIGTGGDVQALAGRVNTLETTVGDSDAGLVKDVADLQTEVETTTTGLLDRVSTIESNYATKVSATAGTGLKTTINSEGIVTGVTTAGTSDLSDWSTVDAGLVHTVDLIATSAGSTDAGKPVKTNSNGKIDNTLVPPLAIAELIEWPTGTAHTKANLILLSSAEKGDIAQVDADTTANNNGVYFLTGAYDTLTNWIQIVGPSNVVSVNGESGVVVLDASDVGAIADTYGPETTISDSDAKIPTSKAVNTALGGKVNALATGPTAGTYTKVTVTADGLVSAGASLVENDIPALSISKTTGLQTALDSKLDDTQLVTSFASTVLDTNIPSEKLVKTALDGKVDKVTGYSLVADTEITKLAGVAAGAQVNVIETVQVNGTALTPSGKTVNVTVPTAVSSLTNDSDYQTGTEVATTVNSAISGQFVTVTLDDTTKVAASSNTYTITTTAMPYGVMVLHTTVNGDVQAFVETRVSSNSIVLVFNDTITPADFKVTYIKATTVS